MSCSPEQLHGATMPLSDRTGEDMLWSWWPQLFARVLHQQTPTYADELPVRSKENEMVNTCGLRGRA